MATRTRKEVVQLAGEYREKLGPEARNFPISDQWGDISTIAGLLIQDPAWQSHLTDDMNDGVYNVIEGWLTK